MAIYVAGSAPVFGPAPEPPPSPPAGPGDGGAAEAGGAGPGAAMAWLTSWDSDADADDFLQTASARLAAMAGAVPGVADSAIDTSERPAVWRAAASAEPATVPLVDDTIYAIERRGTLVALLVGAPAAALPSLTTMLDAAGPRTRRRIPPRSMTDDRSRTKR